jgi:MerR family transcriptional regulator/heat shock protein HspR
MISVAADLVSMHPQTLRIYEQKGLVRPGRTPGGTRLYSERDLDRLQRIQDLTNAGLNLAGVKLVIELEDQLVQLRNDLDRARIEAREAIELVHRKYRRDIVPLKQSPVPYRR